MAVKAKMWTVDDDVSSRYPIYTRGNVGEVFPDPVAPLSWTLAGRPGAELGWRDAWVRTGAFDAEEFGPEDTPVILGVFGSYCYLNVSLARIFAVRAPGFTPEMMDRVLFGTMEGVPPYQPLPTDDDPAKEAAVGRTLQWVFTATDLPEIDEEAELTRAVRAARPVFAAMSDDEVRGYGVGLLDRYFRRLFASHLYISFLATVPLGVVQGTCDAIGQGPAAMSLTAALGGVDSAAPSWALWDLSRAVRASPPLGAAFDAGVTGVGDRIRALAAGGDGGARDFVAGFDAFLVEYGSRGPNEWEMRSPTWETDPELALGSIERMRLADDADSPQARWTVRAAERETLTAQLVSALDADPPARDQFAAAVAACGRFLPARERTKTNVIRLIHESRMAMREWGRRMVAQGHFDEVADFGLLRADELDAFAGDPTALRPAIRERRQQMAAFAELEPPFILVGEEVHYSKWPRRGSRPVEAARSGDVLVGLSGAPGSYTGRARVVLSPDDPAGLEPGDVLVAPLTDPSWTPLFVPSGAVVVDVGAAASHAVIVSREIGLPCVVSVADGTRRIPDGALVTVDGSAGTVTVVGTP